MRDFYAWYFKAEAQREVPTENDAIYKYVAKETIDYVKNTFFDVVDYFTKFGIYTPGEKMPMILGPKIAMADDRYVIPVTFKWPSKDREDDIHLVVYVKKENGAFLIYKVSDIYPYS